MNVYFVLNGITFSWNNEKAQANPLKHDGITFQQAAEAFSTHSLSSRMPVATMKLGMLSLA
jgi:uncharacterized DUF497 family protein